MPSFPYGKISRSMVRSPVVFRDANQVALLLGRLRRTGPPRHTTSARAPHRLHLFFSFQIASYILLEVAGYNGDVRYLEGGWNAWFTQGLPGVGEVDYVLESRTPSSSGRGAHTATHGRLPKALAWQAAPPAGCGSSLCWPPAPPLAAGSRCLIPLLYRSRLRRMAHAAV